jgi:DNA-binding NtrC family response regulator
MSDAPGSAAPGEERPPAILVVDDDALIRLTLSDHLQDCGFKVLEASTGDEALAIMAAPAFTVDLVFTDVTMPGLTDGFALAKWIHENQPGTPVIVTSGDADKIATAHDIGEGIQFVPKPYDLDALTTHIRQKLDLRRRDS